MFSPALGVDYAAKKDSSQKGGLADAILRVRSASIVKMVKIGHRPDAKVHGVSLTAVVRISYLWIELSTSLGSFHG